MSNEYDRLKAQYDAIRAKETAKQEAIEGLMHDLKTERARITDLEAQLADRDAEKGQARQYEQVWQEERGITDQLRADLDAARARITDLEAQVADLQARFDHVTNCVHCGELDHESCWEYQALARSGGER